MNYWQCLATAHRHKSSLIHMNLMEL